MIHAQLLLPTDPDPVIVINPESTSSLFLLCEHGGAQFPARLGSLGLSAAQVRAHYAWDIGAYEVAKRVANQMGATLVSQRYSRLVADCNRDPKHKEFASTLGEDVVIPGNLNLSAEELSQRAAEIFHPFHEAIESLLNGRQERGQKTLLVALHSFTPIFRGVPRPWDLGVQYQMEQVPRVVFDVLKGFPELTVGDNQPYAVTNKRDYTIPRHGEARALPHVLIEIRNNHIDTPEGVAHWADQMTMILSQTLARLNL